MPFYVLSFRISAGKTVEFPSSESGYKVANLLREAHNSKAGKLVNMTCQHMLMLLIDHALDKAPVYFPWPEEILPLLEDAKMLDDNLKQLIQIVEVYEKFGPPHVSPFTHHNTRYLSYY